MILFLASCLSVCHVSALPQQTVIVRHLEGAVGSLSRATTKTSVPVSQGIGQTTGDVFSFVSYNVCITSVRNI